MITQITTENYYVIDKDLVILFRNTSDLSLHFRFDNFEFDVVFQFESDKESGKQDVKKFVDGDTIRINCINFDNELGTGTIQPVDLATINNKKLYIHFWSYVLGSKEDNQFVRKVEYTVFLER